MDAGPPIISADTLSSTSNKHQSRLSADFSVEALVTLALINLPGFGPASYWKLRRRCASAVNIVNTAPDVLSSTLSPEAYNLLNLFLKDRGAAYEQLHRDLDWLRGNDVQVVLHSDSNYPELLKEIDCPPPLLFVRGNVDALSLPQLAVVGSRNPSAIGKDNAFEFSRQLVGMGFSITSGLALGIDAAAHRGAMAAPGPTVAVFGTGMDTVYPHRHRRLAEEIIDAGGALVTEFPLGTAPQANHFPRRNRIISGLSLGVLVVEAALKSGSLITARYALQQGREVFAIPGSIHNPLSRGCHALIRDGATLVESVQDLREPLQGLLALKQQECAINIKKPATSTETKNMELARRASVLPVTHQQLSNEEQAIFNATGYESVDADTLSSRTGLDVATVLSSLLNLELKGLVESRGDGYQRQVASAISQP